MDGAVAELVVGAGVAAAAPDDVAPAPPPASGEKRKYTEINAASLTHIHAGLGAGKSLKDIAAEVGCSDKTVSRYCSIFKTRTLLSVIDTLIIKHAGRPPSMTEALRMQLFALVQR